MSDGIAQDARPPLLARHALRALLAGAIDYAGLFPPASLALSTVVSNYRTYRASPDAWALGRLVIPAARLEELGALAGEAWGGEPGGSPWRISALVGAEPARDASRIKAFNVAHAPRAVVDSVESKALTVEQVQSLAGHFDAIEHFVELPLGETLPELVAAVRDIHARAKMRTGGVTADAFPSPRDVACFLRACADVGLAFKATAGLHHPLRGDYRLTYAPDGPRGTMFGYFNVFLAATQARDGATIDRLVATLEGGEGVQPTIDDAEIRWAGGSVSVAALVATRRDFALAFGSCSFREPLDDLGTFDAHDGAVPPC